MGTAGTALSSEYSPFLELPPELRLMIYELMVHEIIAALISATPAAVRSNALKRPRYFGALALLHTNHIIRKESGKFMYRKLRRQIEEFRDAAIEAMKQGKDDKYYNILMQMGSFVQMDKALKRVC